MLLVPLLRTSSRGAAVLALALSLCGLDPAFFAKVTQQRCTDACARMCQLQHRGEPSCHKVESGCLCWHPSQAQPALGDPAPALPERRTTLLQSLIVVTLARSSEPRPCAVTSSPPDPPPRSA